jgi:diaminohydroxyphosphoribosylaminopyrimidine deaminase/5-amino-6-(5-phosphoribosylamino)uracil reductase
MSDAGFMAHALRLARLGVNSTTPNPRVGCLLVKNGEVIGEGWHRKAGEPHAEIIALQAAGNQASGATAYVTLEPCNHHGKTPPCTEALISAGVKRVVFGSRDPNPLVSGRGIARLEEAGIEVTGPVLEAECAELNAGFFRRMATGLPRVRIKSAGSLDGRTAMASGESQWITGPAARADVQRLRAESCAIVTGIGTILQDDPALTVRDESLRVDRLPLRQPLRVVVDSRLQIPLDAKVLQPPGRCLVATAVENPEKRQQLEEQGAEVLFLPDHAGKVDLPALLRELGQRQCNEVMVESGPGLVGAFLQQQLADEVILYLAPLLLGSTAQPLATLPIDTMAGLLALAIRETRRVGDDLRLVLTILKR